MRVVERAEKVAEGKTKIVWAVLGNPHEVLIESKDDITAGDGARRDILAGKGAFSTKTTCNVFRLLNARGVPTHFIEQVDERTFRAKRVEMHQFELVARRIATGSYLKRHPEVTEGVRFDPLVLEFFFKDDARHDPLLICDLIGRRILEFDAKRPLREGFLRASPMDTDPEIVFYIQQTQVKLLTRVFTILEEVWAELGVTLVDLKIEIGNEVKDGEIVVADVIDNDSWRIWPSGDRSQMRDKEVYRQLKAVTPEALASLRINYAWVAAATEQFVPKT